MKFKFFLNALMLKFSYAFEIKTKRLINYQLYNLNGNHRTNPLDTPICQILLCVKNIKITSIHICNSQINTVGLVYFIIYIFMPKFSRVI